MEYKLQRTGVTLLELIACTAHMLYRSREVDLITNALLWQALLAWSSVLRQEMNKVYSPPCS